MDGFSSIGELQLHNNGTLGSVDNWHCCALPLACRPQRLYVNFKRALAFAAAATSGSRASLGTVGADSE